LVEEIELNLSPTSQRELIINMQRLLGTNQLNQLLFTTHSNYFLGRIDFQVFQAVLDDKGYTDIKGAKIADKKRFSRPDIN
jgi:predicted ATP-dependent endonuclease of OLD family